MQWKKESGQLPEKPRPQRVFSGDEVDGHIERLLNLSTHLAQNITDNAPLIPVPTPDISELLEQSLRESLEHEIVTTAPSRSGDIDPVEVDREVIKKALVSLKLSTLKRLAKASGAAANVNQEDLATGIAKHYKWDSQAVARLILENEDEPSIERGHTSRLFPLEQKVDLDSSTQMLERVVDQYIRIGVARWFLFDELRPSRTSTEIEGTYKTYQASVDSREEVATLGSTTHEVPVRLVVRNSSCLQVNGAAAAPAKSAVKAFSAITHNLAKGHLPLVDRLAVGAGHHLHPTSEFLLDLLYNRIGRSKLSNLNLTVARFNLQKSDSNSEALTVGERRPELKAVRFEGEHILDSASACNLLTLQGRPLVEVAFSVSGVDAQGRPRGRFPVRITAEVDHVAIQTGLGASDFELSLDVHETVVDAVSASFTDGISDSSRISELYKKMEERAVSGEDPAVANMLD